MTRQRLLLIAAAAALVSGCAEAPTAPSPGAARFDGGNSLGSGNAVPPTPQDTTQRGGNSLGSGN